MSEGTCARASKDAIMKLDVVVSARQTAITENREALSKLMVDTQMFVSKLDRVFIQATPVPPPPDPSTHMVPPAAAFSSMPTGDNPPKAFNFSFPCFSGEDPYDSLLQGIDLKRKENDSKAPKKPFPAGVRQLRLEEQRLHREQCLCFNCDEHYHRNHVCKKPASVLLLQDVPANEGSDS